MNGPSASDNKIMLTSETLALFIQMRQGLRKLAIHHKEKEDGYSDDFETDSYIVSDCIKRKVDHFTGEEPKKAKFNPNFWYQVIKGTNPETEPPSDKCEAGSFKVVDYLVRNQKFIVKVREKLKVVDESPEPEDWESEEEEEDDNGYESD
jgi:hypothetical protein